MTTLGGRRLAPAGVRVENRAFDVTPHELVTAYVTEVGIAQSAEELLGVEASA